MKYLTSVAAYVFGSNVRKSVHLVLTRSLNMNWETVSIVSLERVLCNLKPVKPVPSIHSAMKLLFLFDVPNSQHVTFHV